MQLSATPRPPAPMPEREAARPADSSARAASPEVKTESAPTEESAWPDEAAEAAFLGEARERGEVVAPKPAAVEAEETETKPMPKLDDLVNRIPPAVRDALEDLFRAKFVKVQRVPKRALKN